MEQFTFDLVEIRNKWGFKTVSSCSATRGPIPIGIHVPGCNDVEPISAVDLSTSSLALTFRCRPGKHDQSLQCKVEPDIVYWNCRAKSGYSLRLPRECPELSYLLFDSPGQDGRHSDVEHLAAVTPRGSTFVWKVQCTKYVAIGEFSPPQGMSLPRLYAFEHYMLRFPPLELYAFEWEDGTIALYDEQRSLLQCVKATPSIYVPWESLEVEEANPYGIDLEEMKAMTPGGFGLDEMHWISGLILFAFTSLGLLYIFRAV